jgi:wyosine [tRNA(Phe)-imidazoG37] synthetase (radical SAM superfamily)
MGFVPNSTQVEFTSQDFAILDMVLTRVLREYPELDSITLGYNGEPTLVQNLKETIEFIGKIRERSNSKTPITLFTNSSTILDPDVRKKMSYADRIIAKLDAANENTFKKVNTPHSSVPSIEKIIDGLSIFKTEFPKSQLVLQTLLIQGPQANCEDVDIDNLANAYIKIQPDLIHIYTIARPPACPEVLAIPLSELEIIKCKIVDKIKKRGYDFSEKIKIFGP